MKAAVVVNLKAGEEYDVYIGRPSKWGNPFTLRRGVSSSNETARAEVLARYRAYVLGRPGLLNALEELRGKRLGCYCAPLACHGDVLVELLGRSSVERWCGVCIGRWLRPDTCTHCRGDGFDPEARAMLRPSDCGGLMEGEPHGESGDA